jgi:xylose isomerase
MIASWDNPEGPITSNMQLDVTHVLAFLKKFPEEKKVTLTHFFIKLLALVYS